MIPLDLPQDSLSVYERSLHGWSPSGEWLAWQYDNTVGVVNAYTGEVRRWEQYQVMGWSPTADYLLVWANEANYEILDMATGQTVNTFAAAFAYSRFLPPRWSSDGTAVVYHFTEAAMPYSGGVYTLLAGIDGRQNQIAWGDEPSRLIGNLFDSPAHGPWFAFLAGDELVAANIETQETRRFALPETRDLVVYVMWNPDGERALVYSQSECTILICLFASLSSLDLPQNTLTQIRDDVMFDQVDNYVGLYDDGTITNGHGRHWSPDGRHAIIPTTTGEVFLFTDGVLEPTVIPPFTFSKQTGWYWAEWRWLSDEVIYFAGKLDEATTDDFLAVAYHITTQEVLTIPPRIPDEHGATTFPDSDLLVLSGDQFIHLSPDGRWGVSNIKLGIEPDAIYETQVYRVDGDTVYHRALPGCYPYDFIEECVDWLPPQVDVSRLP